MKIIICCNKNDFFLTRICVASIRFYYPDIEIYLIKDYLKGFFNSSELEKLMKVKVLNLGVSKFGWSAAKMHLLLSDCFKGEKLLVLDSDIVFAGKFLDKVFNEDVNYDFAVNADYVASHEDEYVTKNYYSLDYINTLSPEFVFPGYVFNAGQMVITTGMVKQSEVIDFFDTATFPYWKRLDHLPFVDQSLLNYILPLKEQHGEIKIHKTKFMMWSESSEAQLMTIEDVINGDLEYLIHWAGALRVPHLKKMTRSDILIFFENEYYKNIKGGKVKKVLRKAKPVTEFYLRSWYQKFKKLNS